MGDPLTPTEEECLILSNIVYTTKVGTDPHTGKPRTVYGGPEGETVYKWAVDLKANPEKLRAASESGPKGGGPGHVPPEEFVMMVNQIVDNPGVYGQMKVTSVDQGPTSYLSGQWGGAPKPGEETEKHLSARVMIDYGGTPVFVLKGTSGDFDWRDNGMGGYVSVADTIGQQQALDSFLEQMKDFPGDARAVVTGHSKGGNSAQYIGIVAGDRVEQVVSFDGQGFNRIFMLKYGPQIAAHGSKITNISHQHDYVNILLQQVFGSNQYFVDAPLNYDDAVTFERPHIPNSIFHNDGTTLSLDLERDATTQTPAMTQMQELIWFLSGHMTAKDFTFLCYRAVSKLMDTSEPYGDPVSMPLGFFLHLLPLLKNYLEVQGLDAHDTVMFIEEFVEALFPYDENPALNALISGVGGGTFAGLMAVTTSAGYAGAPRDFTDEVRQRFLGLVTETQTVTEWDYTYWDEWELVKNALGAAGFVNDEEQRQSIYANIRHINDTTRDAVERIWPLVAEADNAYAATIGEWTADVEAITQQLHTLAESIPV